MGSVALGTTVSVYNMFDWNRYQHYFAQAGGSAPSVLSFYAAQSLSIFLLLLGSYLTYEYLSRRPSASPASSLFAIIGSAISDRRLRRRAFFAALLYGGWRLYHMIVA